MNMDAVKPGLEVWAKIQGKKYAAVVLETAFSSEGDYLQCKLEIIGKNELTGAEMRYTYPKPVQSYKLTYRGARPPVERRNYKKENEEALRLLRTSVEKFSREFKWKGGQ